jgi:hypothetical protein
MGPFWRIFAALRRLYRCGARAAWLAPSLTLSFLLTTEAAKAGGGPENLLLVVNSADPASQAIANYYVRLREIPSKNIVYLDWKKNDPRIDVNTFRESILRAVGAQIQARSLLPQLDYLVYSSGFPTTIDFRSDMPEELLKQKFYTYPEGSITGLTYLMNNVVAKEPLTYTSMSSNHYMRLRDSLEGINFEVPLVPEGQPVAGGILPEAPRIVKQPIDDQTTIGSHGFRSWYGWGPKGELYEAGGPRYLLSMMLGVTYGRGNSPTEIVGYLKRAAAADGTTPKGTIYYMDTGDKDRSGPRRPAFELCVQLLEKLGVTAKITSGDIPHNRPDVQGLLTGITAFNWRTSGSTILPGAICENLTSFGADFDPKQVQTPISELLRFGASGASGTVVEPYAIQNKFPYALVQVHYARGCTLAEAFYQSVYSPYQLLILGDPLCRPWATIPQVLVQGAKEGDTLQGKVVLNPWSNLSATGNVDRFQLFVDGLLTASCPAGETLEFDSTRYCDGYHELRVVGIENSAIESQGRQIIPVHFNNHGKKTQFSASPLSVRLGQRIKLTANAGDCLGVAFYQNERIIAKFAGSAGETTVDPALLGEGPVTIKAIGWGRGGIDTHVTADPVEVMIQGK